MQPCLNPTMTTENIALSANWSYPTSIRFGAGRIAELAAALAEANIHRPLFVTDRALLAMPMTQQALALLDDLPNAVFADVDPNPTDINLAAAIKVFNAHECDGAVAFGGGSCMDLAKLTVLMAKQTLPVWDLEDIGDWWKRANAEVIFPLVAVPTTAGTGSEVGRAGVLTDSQNKVKKIIFHPQILPREVICDPVLTAAAPPHLTAGAGMDALAHCLEAYCSPHYHPMSQGIALEGMRLAIKHLPRVYADGNDMISRAHMMSAAAMGAVAFQKGLGAIHALSHPIGARYHTHHGMTNAVVLPAVLRFNRPAITDKIAAAAAYIGISGGFDGFYAHLCQLLQTLNIPDKLSALGVENADTEALAAMAVADPSAGGNPIPLDTETAKQLFHECI